MAIYYYGNKLLGGQSITSLSFPVQSATGLIT